jgi:hypothetical protein
MILVPPNSDADGYGTSMWHIILRCGQDKRTSRVCLWLVHGHRNYVFVEWFCTMKQLQLWELPYLWVLAWAGMVS